MHHYTTNIDDTECPGSIVCSDLAGQHQFARLQVNQKGGWNNFNAKSDVSYFFDLYLHFIQQGSSSSTVVHEQRPFERKAEEDDGKVSWCVGDSASLLGLLFMLFASVSSQTALWFERGGFETGVGGQGYIRTIGMPVCHCENRQSDRHIEGLGCCRAFRSPFPHTPLWVHPDTYVLKLCNPAEPAYVLGELT